MAEQATGGEQGQQANQGQGQQGEEKLDFLCLTETCFSIHEGRNADKSNFGIDQ